MTRYYFAYYTKHAAFLGIEAASEGEARDLLERASGDYAFVNECVDLAESEELCDSWAEWDGPHDEEGYRAPSASSCRACGATRRGAWG